MAGRHETLELDVTLSDTLGLFRLNRSIKVEGYVAEVLPLALRGTPSVMVISGAAMGEASGGRRGSGQELYAIEKYGPETERRDIIWKRVARHPEGDLLSRVREANLPDSIDVCLLRGGDSDREIWMDLASEAVAQLGVDLIGLGMGIRVPTQRGGHAVRLSAYTRDELTELTVAIWQPDLSLEPSLETIANSGILIAEESALQQPEVLRLSLEKPSIIVSEEKGHGKGQEGVIRFSGSEDLSSAILQVIGQ